MEDTFDFGEAIRALRSQQRVARTGWNDKDIWLSLIGHTFGLPVLPYIAMKTAQSDLVPWFPSQTDMLADDWQLVL